MAFVKGGEGHYILVHVEGAVGPLQTDSRIYVDKRCYKTNKQSNKKKKQGKWYICMLLCFDKTLKVGFIFWGGNTFYKKIGL